VVSHHAILFCRQVITHEATSAKPFRLVRDKIERRRLDLPAEDATTHQPGIDCQVFAVGHLADHDADNSVVAKPVDQAQLQPEGARIIDQRQHILFRIAPGRQVELIGLVDQLHRALQPDLVEPLPDQPHFKAAKICVQIGRRGLQLIAFAIALILLRADSVFVGDRDALEIPRIRQGLGVGRGILRHFRHRDHQQVLAHEIALERVVVDKHQRIDADIELFGDGSQV